MPKCPVHDIEMVLRRGPRGQFYGCRMYPNCKKTLPYKQERRVVDNTASRKNWSQYQLNIFDAVGRSNDNLQIEAVAGSGKTTTAVAALDYASRYRLIAFIAFNRVIANDFKTKVPDGVHASTYHALGLKSIMQARGKSVKVDETKDFSIFTKLADSMPAGSQAVVTDYRSEILRLVSLAKNTMGDGSSMNLQDLADNYSIDLGTDFEHDVVLDTAHLLFEKSAQDEATINFDDMIWWCATGRVEPLAFDFVVTDEMQDTNMARLRMLLRMLRNGGRSVAVGDRHQSIYAWAGAHQGAMDVFKELTNATELELSITYRCPNKHVEMAQRFVPQIKARPDAPDGTVEYIKDWQLERVVKDGDLVICRTNAPLVKPAFALLAQGRKAIIVGKDIGSGLINLVNRISSKEDVTSATFMLTALDAYVHTQQERLNKAGKFGKAEFLQDQLDTVEAVSDGCQTVDEVTRKIAMIFSDQQEGVRFSSIHRAKGTEADEVFIVYPDLMPHPMAGDNPEALQQEANIEYVSLTRAKKSLTFVERSNR